MKSRILEMDVDVTNINSVVSWVRERIFRREGAYVCLSNVHMCMEVYDNPFFSKVVNSAGLVLPDGRPIFWAQKFLGFSQATHTRGEDVMAELCAISAKDNIKIGLYGGSSADVLDKVESALAKRHEGIKIVYRYSPPFRELSEGELDLIASDIEKEKVDILFVGIGCPKQEIWMHQNLKRLNCVMLGVGAAFDFISGSKKHAPRYMQFLGLEWLHRLFSEPKRLWKRYLKQNPRFLFIFIKRLLFKA